MAAAVGQKMHQSTDLASVFNFALFLPEFKVHSIGSFLLPVAKIPITVSCLQKPYQIQKKVGHQSI